MKPMPKRIAPVMLLIPLAALLAGCKLSSLPTVPEPAEVPPLPKVARQPQPPSECLPKCSAGLTKLRTELLDSLTKPTQPALPVSAHTTR